MQTKPSKQMVKIAQLINRCMALEDRCSANSATIHIMTAEAHALTEENQRLKLQNSKLQASLSSCQTNVHSSVQQQISEQASLISKLRIRETKNEEVVTDLINQLTKAQQHLADRQKNCQELQKKIDNISAAKKTEKCQNKQSPSEKIPLQNVTESKELKQLEQNYKSLQEDYEKLVIELTEQIKVLKKQQEEVAKRSQFPSFLKQSEFLPLDNV